MRVNQEELKYDIRQRLAMLEAAVLWDGRVTTTVLSHLFGIARGQASRDFTFYQQLAPNNLVYDRYQKAYLPTDTFSPLFMQGTAEEYLQLARVGHTLGQSIVLPIVPTAQGVEILSPPTRKLDLNVLRLVHQAIRTQRQIQVYYQSMTKDGRDILLEPHSLVFNGFRWHVRAFSHEHHQFRDFVLARFASKPVLLDTCKHCIEDDVDWQQFDILVIAPNPNLTPAKQSVIAEDYGMEEEILRLRVRRALVLYYKRMLHLDEGSQDPSIQQIVLLKQEPAA